MAYTASQRRSVQALHAPASMSPRVKPARQSQSQRQPDVTISDLGQVRTPTYPRRIAALSRRSSTDTVREDDIPPLSTKITEETRLSPPRDNMAQEEKQRAAAEAKMAEAQRLKAEVDAKKAQREATKQQEKERLQAQSKETYDKFIETINQYNFDTSPEEPSYIKFSKFIQVIMDLQFSIKDDQIRKKAQTITDQILNAYSALVSFYCSNNFLKTHFEDYSKKLKLKIQIKDLKQPTVNIDSQVSSITPKLDKLASTQDCNPPTSQHIVPETPADISDSTFRFPSLRFPSIRSSNSTNTYTDETLPTLPPPRTTTELMDMQGNPQQEEQPEGRQRSLFNKLASRFRSQKNTSAKAADDDEYKESSPPGTVIQLKTFVDQREEKPPEGIPRPESNRSRLRVPTPTSIQATASPPTATVSASPAAKPPPQSIAEWNSKNYRVDIEPKSGTGGGGKQRLIIFSDDGLRFAWGKDEVNVQKRANNQSPEKVDHPNQVILIDGKIKIDDVIKSQYHESVCSDNNLCILVEGYTITPGSTEKAWAFTFSTDDEKNMFFRVLNDLCDKCVDKNREKIQKEMKKINKKKMR
jgi:hypothetical protein